MMLQGAEVLMFPTAIGTEPHDPSLDTRRMWRRAMVGHAVSNVVGVVACAGAVHRCELVGGDMQRFIRRDRAFRAHDLGDPLWLDRPDEAERAHDAAQLADDPAAGQLPDGQILFQVRQRRRDTQQFLVQLGSPDSIVNRIDSRLPQRVLYASACADDPP